jgi:hypothetical protein
MSDVAMKVWIRGFSASRTAIAARSMSVALGRASPATVTPRARRLLAVAKRRVEDDDTVLVDPYVTLSVAHDLLPSSGRIAGPRFGRREAIERALVAHHGGGERVQSLA